MRFHYVKMSLKTAVTVTLVLLLGASLALAQQQVNLAAGPSSVTLPDGSTVPMWGYSCGTAVTGSTATCSALHKGATGWSPVVVTVPTGQDLQINLTNNLTFTPPGATTPNNIPTSLTIVGQLGGGLGTTATTTPPPSHPTQTGATWPVAGGTATFTPPVQGPRVQSFSTEVAVGTTASLTWTAPRPGTYLIESGTHPSIQGPMGLYGILVVTSAPTTDPGTGAETAPGTAYSGVTYAAEVPLLLSEIDPIQNNAVNAAVNTAGFSETAVWSGLPSGCGNPLSGVGVYQTCYPPAVNYTPLYYLFNGVAFDKTNANTSLFSALPAPIANPVAGNVLVRFVNAGLRMHVPSIVGAQTGTAVAPALPPSGFSLIAEDGNLLPGIPRVQSEVFMAPGKTYDVMINVPAAGSALPVFDRELSLSGNAVNRDAGMLAYIGINGAALPSTGAFASAKANADNYPSLVAGQTFTVSDPSKGVIANDVNVYGVQLSTLPAHGTVSLNADGTFTYAPTGTTTTSDSFGYCANGVAYVASPLPAACTTVTLGAATLEGASGIVLGDDSYVSNVATTLSIKSPGVLLNDKDLAGYPLSVDPATYAFVSGPGTLSVVLDKTGAFNASASAPGTYTFTYGAINSQGTKSVATTPATVTLVFPTGSGLTVSVVDGTDKKTAVSDYRWIIEEDRTFYIDPKCTTNPPPMGCPTVSNGIVPTFGTNFHTSYMPVVATGCMGTLACEAGQSVLGATSVCDIGDGVCEPGAQQAPLDPKQVYLDPTKRYYISVLPGDAANSFENLNNCLSNPTPSCGHGMGGAPITFGQTSVTVLVQPNPYPPSKLSVVVFEDDFPLNGEQDAGGGVDVLAVHEPGLGQFNIHLMDDAGGPGDATGQMTYDMFNQPLSNSLAGTIDPATGKDACPISTESQIGMIPDPKNPGKFIPDPTQTGITGTIVTCPKYEADGVTLSPLAGQAVIANLMPGRFGVIATPGADRIARGEEWLQTNTLDGQKAHDSFLRIGEPSFFQEFGPAGYHVAIGFASPGIINRRLPGICKGLDENVTGVNNCQSTLKGVVTTERMSRTPDERLYSSGDNSSFAFTQCYVSVGDPDGEDFAFTKCKADGTFSFTGLPNGSWRVTVFDQWNDMLVDGLSTPVALSGSNAVDMGQIAINQWQANFYTRSFLDDNKDGVSQSSEGGLALVKTNVRFRDGSFSNRNNTDINGYAAFNEEFPLFSWYVVETDVTRYKNTGTHVVYDAGGPADGTPGGGPSTIGKYKANTIEQIPLPADLRVPGAVYCDKADCAGFSIASGPGTSLTGSTGRIDPPWVLTEAWQGFSGQNNFLEFGKTPYVPGETGGIRGHVVYSSTRPFDDPQFGTQNVWEPLVPNVTINLYQEGTAGDGITPTLKLVDTTKTSSWDDWAQGFRSDGKPNMNCPGQATASGPNGDLFFFSLYNQPNWLDVYHSQHGGPAPTALPYNSQFKCYDAMHNWNQLQPAPYDGMYQFPSVTGLNPSTGKPTGTNCTICLPNPDATDIYRNGLPMLPAGKYVVEVVVPPGYELVKEEDKNILIGDNFIAPVTQEFGGLGNIFILPDQAQIGAAFNPNNPQNSTQTLGRIPTLTSHEGDTPTVDTFWPCVGATRIVPDFISLFPQSAEVSPFAGATRNLCDRKEVTLDDQTSSQAEFFIFTSTHAAAHFTGVITDDFTSEFDPFSPQFGEKFSPPNLPVSLKDWTGTEISRVYTDHWGAYNGLTYSTWEVNPPNPTGYSPTMMVTCMNDPGTGATPDPLFNPEYSQFCYEIPFMPGATQYMDTPVVPTSAFAGAGYNNPDCAYPDATPAVSEVDGDSGLGPYVSAGEAILTIKALGDQTVPNNAYSGPSATTAPFNQKTITRHYGFGSQCTSPTAGSATCNTLSNVTIGGKNAPITSWIDSAITVRVPTGTLPNNTCPIQQQAQYVPAGTTIAQCGELVITAGNGKQSVDAVTVTIGGKKPTHVPTDQPTIQAAIDNAQPGDLIMVNPGAYNEMLIMWKPVRLQGVGAASSVVNANTHPAGKLDPWRRQIACLFGLAVNGQPLSTSNQYDSTGTFTCGGWPGFSAVPNDPQVDRLPMEGVVGWDTSVNGNLAQLLQEPTLMGAYEGAGITVLSKGVNTHGAAGYFGAGATESAFPTGTTLLTSADCATGTNNTNRYPSNFQCNPSSIDGLSITNSSQGGGGILVHAWGHNLQIANDRVYNNSGTLTGGITIGQGESPDAYLSGSASDSDPGSCLASGSVLNQQLPYCFDTNVNVHNNYVARNSSIGDELFSSTPAGAGGVTFCTGADYYKFNYNWVCGNLSTGDGGGMAHLGFIWNGDIEHNSFLFNQSTNPTVPTNGGGLIVMGAPPDGFTAAGIECGGTAADLDCVPGLADGTGPGLVINANLFMGNSADSGSGGGLRFQGVNGTEVSILPKTPKYWNSVNVTNNIIANNVAGWDGAGVSLVDALNVNLINNTIVSNDTTASSGVLFNTLGAPLASSTGINCQTTTTSSCPQPAGLVAIGNSPQLSASFAGVGTITCPANHPNCTKISYPYLANDLFWQNRSFYIGVGALGTGNTNQQNVVSLYNSFTTTLAASQASTGACPTASYWDIGVRGDKTVNGHESGWTLAPSYSVLTDAGDYPGLHNLAANPTVVSQYCNGSRVPPEFGGMGYQVPAGISDATVPNPIFSLTPSATVDEGNNWINLSWGPLALTNPAGTTILGNYALAAGSPAIDYVPNTSPTFAAAPNTDFFGHARPDPVFPTAFDIGAVEYQLVPQPPTLSSIAPARAAKNARGNTTVAVTLTGTHLFTATGVTVSGTGVTATNVTAVTDTTATATFTIAAAAATGDRTVTITTLGGTSNGITFTVAPTPNLTSIAPNSGVRGTAVPVTLTGTSLTGTTSVTVSGNGVTVSNLVVVNDTSVTATFTIASNATLSARNVSVQVGSVVSNNVTFTVIPVVAPTLSSINPSSGLRGTAVPVTLTGTGLTGASAVTVSGNGVAVSNLTVSSDTTATATFTITATAAASNRNVTITTSGGTSNAVVFTVQAPALTSITPSSGARGNVVPVTLTGTNLSGTTGVTVSGGGVTVSGVTPVNATTVTATFTINAGATLSARNVSVTTSSNGTSNNVTFTVVNAPAPTLTSVNPNSGVRGTAVPVTLTGSNFTTTGTTVAVSGGGVAVSGLTVVNSTTINATFTITNGAALGARDVTVTTPGNQAATLTGGFTVQGPTLTSISPATGAHNTTVPVTLTGTNLTGATAVTIAGGGVNCTVTSTTATTVNASCAITNGASRTARNVTATTPIGATNTLTGAFTVN